MTQTQFFGYVCSCNLDLENMTLGQSNGTPLDHGRKLWSSIPIHPTSEKIWLENEFWLLLHCDLDYGSRSWHIQIIGSWTITVRNIIQIHQVIICTWTSAMFTLWHWKHDLVSGSCNRLRHNLINGQQLCYVSSKSKFQVKKNMDIPCVYRDLEDRTLGQGHDTAFGSWTTNYVKYRPYQTYQWKVTAWTWMLAMCALWPWPWIYDLQSMGHGQL